MSRTGFTILTIVGLALFVPTAQAQTLDPGRQTFEVRCARCHGADGNGAIVSAMTQDDLLLRAGTNDTKITIKASGDIGIGTDTPQAKLDIAKVKTAAGGGGLA